MSNVENSIINSYIGYSNVQHSIPYVYTLNHKQRSILYCGMSHQFRKNNEIKFVESMFEIYNPELVFVEGIPWLNNNIKLIENYVNVEKCKLYEYGENILFAVLSYKMGKKVISPEPLLINEMFFVCKSGFSILDFLTFFILKLARQWMIENKTSEQSFIKKCDAYLLSQLKDLYLPYQECIKKRINLILNSRKESTIGKIIDPVPRIYNFRIFDEKYNKISRFSNVYRDMYMIDTIKKYSKKYSKIMIVYGATHAYVQKNIIKSCLAEDN